MTFLAGRRPSAAGVIAIGALVCAMSGTAVASASSLSERQQAHREAHACRATASRTTRSRRRQIKQPVWHPLPLVNGWTEYDRRLRRPAVHD